jgi:hypothetical protein
LKINKKEFLGMKHTSIAALACRDAGRNDTGLRAEQQQRGCWRNGPGAGTSKMTPPMGQQSRADNARDQLVMS